MNKIKKFLNTNIGTYTFLILIFLLLFTLYLLTINSYNKEIILLKENKEQSEKWKQIQKNILEQEKIIQDAEKYKKELIEKKEKIEKIIQTNREKLVGKK